MDNSYNSIIEVFRNFDKYEIPIYQRSYKWGKEKCRELFDTVMKVDDSDPKIKHEYFFGSIMLNCNNEKKCYEVIDGQQRLITFSLLFKAIADVSIEYGDFKSAQDIENRVLFRSKIGEDNRTAAITSNKYPDSLFYNILLGIENTRLSEVYENYKHSHFYENYMFFKEAIKEVIKSDNFPEIKKPADIYKQKIEINSNKGVKLFTVLLTEYDDIQNIFESINSAAEPLTNAELVINYLLMGNDSKIQDVLYETYLEDLENRLVHKDYCDKKGKDFNQFIKHYLVLKQFQPFDDDRVYKQFKNYIINLKVSGKTINEIIEELCRYGHYYARFKSSEVNSSNIFINLMPQAQNSKFAKKINSTLAKIKEFRNTDAYPLMLYTFDKCYFEHAIDEEILLNILNLILAHCVRRRILSLPSNGFNSATATVLKNLSKISDKGILLYNKIVDELLKLQDANRFPTDDEVINFCNIEYKGQNKNVIRLILAGINNACGGREEITSKLTIEHIAPQNLTKWQQAKIDTTEIENLINTLGNLTLIDGGSNSEIQNDTFDVKKTIYTSSNVWLTRELLKYNTFAKNEILKRQEELLKKVVEIWKYPSYRA